MSSPPQPLLRNRLRERLLLRIYRHEVFLLVKLDELRSTKGYTRTRMSHRTLTRLMGFTFLNTRTKQPYAHIVLHQEWARPLLWVNHLTNEHRHGTWVPQYHEFFVETPSGRLRSMSGRIPGRFPNDEMNREHLTNLQLAHQRIM